MSSKTDQDATPMALVVATTVVVATALRLPGLNSGLWYDEIVTLVQSARLPFRQIVTEFAGMNAHPLYSVLAHGSLQIFGESAWSLRLPAAIFGVLSVAMVYALGVRLTTRLEAWAAAAVLATSYHHIWFSQNARGYTLIGFLTLASTLVLLRAAETGKRRDYVLYALISAAGIYTHLTMAFVVAGHVCVVLVGYAAGWQPARRQPLLPMLGAWIGVGVLCALAYAPFIPGLLAVVGVDAPREAAKVATPTWAFLEAIRSLLSGTGMPAALLGSALAVVAAFSLWRRQPFAFALLMVPGLITGLALLALKQPIRPRFFFFLSGAAAILVGRGIGAVVAAFATRPAARSAGIVSCALLVIALSATALPRNYSVPKQDFEGAVRFLEAAETQGAEIVAVGPGCLPLKIYYRKPWRCLERTEDWPPVAKAPGRVLVMYTLADYIDEPSLRAHVLSDCRVVERFSGTLGGGDINVCEVPRPLATRGSGL